LKPYVGTYEFFTGFDYFVTLDGDQLMGRLGKQASFPLFPQSPTYFFLKVVDAQVEFQKDTGGAMSLVLHQNGEDHTARRISTGVAAPAAHKEIKVPADALGKLVGIYQLAPHAELSITLEGDQLGVQLTGQPRFPIFPEAQNKFFLTVVEAQLEFIVNPDGTASAVILHQNGIDQKAPKE
jgi:D-alanyl-D-alanine-carboxypeptidase/D-alanyl-D-alanine-endopeptidase